MGKELMIYFDEDGVAREYDDTYDITIHCESEEEKRKAIEFIKARKWIPFRSRPMTEEEKEMHPDMDGILDCKLPDDGQAILVTIEIDGRRWVSYDEYYEDGGSYLDSGYEICTEAIAWMPLPAPYRTEGDDNHEG